MKRPKKTTEIVYTGLASGLLYDTKTKAGVPLVNTHETDVPAIGQPSREWVRVYAYKHDLPDVGKRDRVYSTQWWGASISLFVAADDILRIKGDGSVYVPKEAIIVKEERCQEEKEATKMKPVVDNENETTKPKKTTRVIRAGEGVDLIWDWSTDITLGVWWAPTEDNPDACWLRIYAPGALLEKRDSYFNVQAFTGDEASAYVLATDVVQINIYHRVYVPQGATVRRSLEEVKKMGMKSRKKPSRDKPLANASESELLTSYDKSKQKNETADMLLSSEKWTREVSFRLAALERKRKLEKTVRVKGDWADPDEVL